MGIKKALLFSFAGHLFFFSFFRFTLDINSADLTEKLSVAFLGSILSTTDFYPHRPGKTIFTPLEMEFVMGFTDHLNYLKSTSPKMNLLRGGEKPLAGLGNISPPKLLNKFLVFQPRVVPSEKQMAQDRYLATRPAWERVDLKLKVE